MSERSADLPEGCDVVLYWIQSDRDPTAQVAEYEQHVVGRCRAAAAELGMDLRLVGVDDIVVGRRGEERQVWVSGDPVTPSGAFFHTKYLSWPAYEADAWRHLTTYGVLEAVGFCLTVPPLHSIGGNDKLLSALAHRDCGLPSLPTVRLCTRGIDPRGLDLDAWGLEFPLVVKPASWGGGMGVLLARDRAEFNATVQLAGASELTVVLQPWLGPDVVDHRIYCVDGEPHAALTRRAAPSGLAGNLHQGGRAEMAAIPEALVAPARHAARATGLPYTCVDFLAADGAYWFSEIEVDGGTGTGGPELTKVRFGAYRGAFDAFQADRASVKRWRYA